MIMAAPPSSNETDDVPLQLSTSAPQLANLQVLGSQVESEINNVTAY